MVTTNCSNNYTVRRQLPEKLIPVVIQSLLSRQPIPVYGDGLHVRDWLFCAGPLRGALAVLTRGRDGEVCNNIGGTTGGRTSGWWRDCVTASTNCARIWAGNSRRLVTFVADRPGHDRRYAIDAGKIEREWAGGRRAP